MITTIDRWSRRLNGVSVSVLAWICALILPIDTLSGGPRASPPVSDASVAAVRQTLRIVDCARCHGRDYAGLAAPSIVNYARTQDRETFVRMVLEGDPARGMPAYRNNPLVSASIDEIYRYFVGRANGSIAAEYRPSSEAQSLPH